MIRACNVVHCFGPYGGRRYSCPLFLLLILSQSLLSHHKLPTDSPRKLASVFILCTSDLAPVGTAFIVSPTRVLTAFHNVGSLTSHRRYTDPLVLVRGLERLVNGNVVVVDEGPIPVEIARYSWTSDWALLSRTDGLEFISEQIVEICPANRIPKDEDEAKIKIYHCPVILFVQEYTPLLKPLSVESKFGSSSKHSFLCHVGLFAGSSGALVVLANGLAIGMHIEAVNSAMSLTEVLAKRVTAGEPEGSFADQMEDVSDSCVQSVGALSKAIILSRYPTIMNNLT